MNLIGAVHDYTKFSSENRVKDYIANSSITDKRTLVGMYNNSWLRSSNIKKKVANILIL